jgi:hypothetical protein
MYLQSGKAYFAVWLPADCPSPHEIVAVDSLALSVRRLTGVRRAAFAELRHGKRNIGVDTLKGALVAASQSMRQR